MFDCKDSVQSSVQMIWFAIGTCTPFCKKWQAKLQSFLHLLPWMLGYIKFVTPLIAPLNIPALSTIRDKGTTLV